MSVLFVPLTVHQVWTFSMSRVEETFNVILVPHKQHLRAVFKEAEDALLTAEQHCELGLQELIPLGEDLL